MAECQKGRSVTDSVAVIVPALNASGTIGNLIDALAQQSLLPTEVIVVNDSSEDATVQVARGSFTSYPELNGRVINNPKRNIPSALNYGISKAKSEVIIRLDAHVIPEKNYVEQCITNLQKAKHEIFNVGGCWDIKSRSSKPVAQAIAWCLQRPLGAGNAAYRVGSLIPKRVDTVPYGCFAKSTWQFLGGFDETLSANEDYAFNYQIRQAGGAVWLDPSIRATYFSPPTIPALWQKYWRYGVWKMIMLKKHPQSLRLRQLLPLLLPIGVISLLALVLMVPLIGIALGLLFIVPYCVDSMRNFLITRNFRICLYVPIVYLILQLAWALGAWNSLLFSPQFVLDGR